MKKGFWVEFEEYLNENPEEAENAEMDGYIQTELTFSTCEERNEDGLEPDYLHGSCTTFAQCLNEVFGYKVECVYQTEDPDDSPQLVHAYCTTQTTDGKTFYVDVRGMIDDYDKFMAEFYDAGLWSNDDYSFTESDMDSIPDRYKESAESFEYQAAKKVIKDFGGYYAA